VSSAIIHQDIKHSNSNQIKFSHKNNHTPHRYSQNKNKKIMVMQVEVRHEESFRSLPDEDVQVVLLEEQDYSRNNANASMLSMGRDTSNTCRDVSLDNTRQTVNTHDSILDLTKDEEEDDEDDDYWNRHDGILFDDLQTLSREDYSTYDEDDDESSPIPTEPTSLLSKFTFDHVTDSFVDSLCPVVMMSSCSTSRFQTPCASTTRTTLCVPQQRVQISMDVWKLLGCNAAPDDAELESIWSLRTSPVEKAPGKPVRTHMTNRLQRIHRLRMARMSGPTRHGITLAGPHVMERSYTMNDHHPLAEVIGKGMDPILPEQEDGYDSDPEIGGSTVMAATTPRFPSSHSPLLDQEEGEPTDLEEQDRMIQETVQVRHTIRYSKRTPLYVQSLTRTPLFLL
jgi:hypothetical protein